MTPDELAPVARDALKRLDPDGVQRRAKAARDQADVEFYPDRDGDGMGDVVIHAPIENATLVKTGVDAYAARLKAAGDPRPIGVIAEMIRTELPKLRLLVLDPDSGRLLYRATSAYRPTPDQVAQSAPPGRSGLPRSGTSSRSTAPGTKVRPKGNCPSLSTTTVPSR